MPATYSIYGNVFPFNLVIELLENTGINKYAIELVEDKQPLYGLIYTLSPIELEILKTYIETYLKIGFIRPFKSHVKELVLFDKKADSSLCLCIN